MRGKPDQQRFEALLREHLGIVLKVAGVYARGREERDDLAQEIAAQCWRSFGGFDERRAKFSTWMYRVALNVAISHARRRKRDLAGHFESLEMHHLETIGAEIAEEADERLAALRTFIAELDGLNRALILLYMEERSYAEMADVLGISETNVATKIARIKQKLRSRMVETTIANTGT
jgi:RNA polymerase sigma-70 factor (ECF subfamily)